MLVGKHPRTIRIPHQVVTLMVTVQHLIEWVLPKHLLPYLLSLNLTLKMLISEIYP